MAELSGAAIPPRSLARLDRVAEDPEAVRAVGIEIATELCRDLVAAGVPGLHFYTMNQVSATVAICENLGLVPPRRAVIARRGPLRPGYRAERRR